VARVNSLGQTIVKFNMNGPQEALNPLIIQIHGATAQPPLSVKDFLLVQMNWKGEELWTPGCIVTLPSETASSPAIYTVQIFVPTVQFV
jgi:hypothetical protein